MADTHLKFTIGSVFQGEGFKQAQQSVSAVNTNIKKASSITGELSSALGQMDTSMSKGAQAATGMIQALMSMNVTTIVVQGAMIAFNMYVQKVNEEMEELTKRSEAAKAAVEKAFEEKLSSRIKEVKDEIEEITSGFESLTKAANAITAAMTGIRNADASGDIIALQTEKLQKMLEARTEAEREHVEKSYAILEAKANLANVEAECADKENQARQKVIDSKNRVANIEEAASKAAEERAQLEEIISVQKQSGDENWIKVQKRVTELKETEADLEKRKNDELDKIEVLLLEEEKVKRESINAQEKAKNQILQVEVAQKAEEDAAKEQAEKTRELAKKSDELKQEVEDRKEAETELKDRMRESAELQKSLNDSQSSLKSAIEEYNNVLSQYAEAIAVNDYYNNPNFKGGTMPVDIVKGIALQTADAKVDDAIRNGTITTVKDADRMRRQEYRDSRTRENKISGQRSQEAQRYQRLLKQNEKALCEADKHFMKEYEKIRDAQNRQKQAVEDSKKKVEEQTKLVKEINSRLKNIGLK